MAAMEVYFFAIDSSRMIVATSWLLAKSLRLTPANQVVQIKHIQVVECFFAIPATKNIQIVAHFVT